MTPKNVSFEKHPGACVALISSGHSVIRRAGKKKHICMSERKVAGSRTADASPGEYKINEGNEDGRITGALS